VTVMARKLCGSSRDERYFEGKRHTSLLPFRRSKGKLRVCIEGSVGRSSLMLVYADIIAVVVTGIIDARNWSLDEVR
jgi:hypothetical protein